MKQERETLQELITEAHQVTKDLRGLLREAKGVEAHLRELVQGEQTRLINEWAEPKVTEFITEFKARIDEIDATIMARYQDTFRDFVDREGDQVKFGETPQDAVLRIIQEKLDG